MSATAVFAAGCEDDEGESAIRSTDAGRDGGVDAPLDGGGDGRDGGADMVVPGPTSSALSGIVAARFVGVADLPAATNIKELILGRIRQLGSGTLPPDVDFPLPLAATDSVRVVAGIRTNLMIRWLDPLGFDNSANGSVFGANPDYISFIPDDWGAFPADTAIWPSKGRSTRGWMWVNHEYISNLQPTAMSAPTGQALALAQYLKQIKAITGDPTASMWQAPDLDKFVLWHKKMVGGSWMRVVQDSASGDWVVDRGVRATRFDATSDSLFRMGGLPWAAVEKADDGVTNLPAGVVPGTAGNCSGGTTPWGTIITAEENVQGYYGDLEPCWNSNQTYVPNMGCNPGGPIALNRAPTKPAEIGFFPSTAAGRHAKDTLGWLVEIDPGQPAGEFEGKTMPGVGHKKLGAMGRARWENATFAVGPDFKLMEGKPIVVYAGDDRRGGRIWKFVTRAPWSATMMRAQTRALLDDGNLYAAHFAGLDNAVGDKLVGGADPTAAAPGLGRWVKMSLESTDVAPNAAALGVPTKTVGEALADVSWNKLGGFTSNLDVLSALFTAAAKVGIVELNRPEDLEYNPKDPSGTPRIYVAFTNHTGGTQLDQNGVVRDPLPPPPMTTPPTPPMMLPIRADKVG
ncbi:MAG TPA: alkaline phosphatase PhoX, partial [Polyangia bacterium]